MEHAVAYPRAGGTSYWSAIPGGLEEWLWLAPGAAPEGAAATWEIDGAALAQDGDAVNVLDDDGAARVRVTAPAAYASGGRVVPARLEAHGARLELHVDAGGEEVLVDPVWTMTLTSMPRAHSLHSATLLNMDFAMAAPIHRPASSCM